LCAIGSSGKSAVSNGKVSGDVSVPLATIQFGSSIRIGPVTIGTVIIKTTATILAATVKASVKMVAAEILVANRA
jgi:hypothetical protein